jgi:hypothetical protein
VGTVGAPGGDGGREQDEGTTEAADLDRPGDGGVPNPETGAGIGAAGPSTFEPEEDALADDGG